MKKSYEITSNSPEDTLRVARRLGALLKGGEAIELVSDVGGGKTAFVRGLAQGIESTDQVQSPTFTISRIYNGRDGIALHHFDFYRLNEPGIMQEALVEVVADPKAIVAIEWGEIVENVLPAERLQVHIAPTGEESRLIKLKARGTRYQKLLEALK